MEICLPSFPEDSALCSFSYCQDYIRRTKTHRPEEDLHILFLSYSKPHKLLKICTIVQWVKEVLSLSGIDISQFSAHLTLPLQHLNREYQFQTYESSRLDPSIHFQEVLPEDNQGFLWSKNFVICKYRGNPQLWK